MPPLQRGPPLVAFLNLDLLKAMKRTIILNLGIFGKKHLADPVSRISIFNSIISIFNFRIFMKFASRGFHVSPKNIHSIILEFGKVCFTDIVFRSQVALKNARFRQNCSLSSEVASVAVDGFSRTQPRTAFRSNDENAETLKRRSELHPYPFQLCLFCLQSYL